MFRPGVLLMTLGLATECIAGSPSNPSMRIGAYDSRAVAIAFANSKEGTAFVADLHAKMMKAMETKDDTLIQQVKTTAQAYQLLNHLRGFSVGSVADILQKHRADVEAIAEETGVFIIVSKYELIHTDPDVDVVDVTMHLVNIWEPSDRVLGWISELPQQEPLSMLEVLALPTEE